MNPTHWLIGIATTLLFGLLIKQIPGWLAHEEDVMLSGLLAQGDDADDELLLAMVKWADKKIPGGDSGHTKYLAVANLVAARFPLISAEKLDQLIEAAVNRLKEEAERKIQAGVPPSPGSPAA